MFSKNSNRGCGFYNGNGGEDVVVACNRRSVTIAETGAMEFFLIVHTTSRKLIDTYVFGS